MIIFYCNFQEMQIEKQRHQELNDKYMKNSRDAESKVSFRVSLSEFEVLTFCYQSGNEIMYKSFSKLIYIKSVEPTFQYLDFEFYSFQYQLSRTENIEYCFFFCHRFFACVFQSIGAKSSWFHWPFTGLGPCWWNQL